MFQQNSQTIDSENPISHLCQYLQKANNTKKLKQFGKKIQELTNINQTYLRNLDLSYFVVIQGYLTLQDQGMDLVSKIYSPHLQSLNLWRCNIGAQGIYYLSKMKLTNLKVLFLGGNDFGPNGIQILVGIQELKNIEDIRLERNGLGKEGAQYFSKNEWEHLSNIIIGINNIGDEGLACLHHHHKWPKLHSIMLYDNGISMEGLNNLRNDSDFYTKLDCLQIKENKFNFVKK